MKQTDKYTIPQTTRTEELEHQHSDAEDIPKTIRRQTRALIIILCLATGLSLVMFKYFLSFN